MSKQIKSFARNLLTLALMSGSEVTHALGLGNIEIQSRLGEPLRAQIQLADIPERLDVDCFKLLRGNEGYKPSAFNASMVLRKNETGNAILLIRSYQVVEDPIVQLTLVAGCETQTNREYVLLLDPPQLHASDDNELTASAGLLKIPAPTVETATESLSLPVDAQSPNTHAQTVLLKTDKPRNNSAARTSRKNSDTTSPSASAETKATPVASGESRLVVSGNDYSDPDFSGIPLQLQMSKELNTWPMTETQALSPEDVSDEITAMANKLVYLEAQMIALQKRNTELENLRTQQEDSGSWLSWLLYTLITMAVLALIGTAEWLRRRHSQLQLATEVAMWEELAPAVKQLDMAPHEDLLMPEAETGNGSTHAMQAGSAESVDFPQQPQAIFRPSDNGNHEAGATVNEDILEQADVFVAHGRSNLAIVLLQDHLRDFPDLSPEPWLMLLDLLKREGQAEEYESTAAECKRYFNVAIKDFNSPPLEDNSCIEDYPHVTDQLVQVWGSTEAVPYLDDLIFNRRPEARQGFERSACLDIVQLRSIASELKFTAPLNTKIPAANTADYLLKETPDSPGLPIDKSRPLEFELDIKNLS
ncbi:MAG: hypothetical protein CVU35_06655 [Betaproteobacteria bacterium HGW-Betaproteobacteria-8]|nr:MAG: hypothetical protein CVU35_06655 [Betaproteobacteria bacterium HGW-Betaproteobacteria-8]